MCQSGSARSGPSALLRAAGMGNVHVLEGGMQEWIAAGNPVRRDPRAGVARAPGAHGRRRHRGRRIAGLRCSSRPHRDRAGCHRQRPGVLPASPTRAAMGMLLATPAVQPRRRDLRHREPSSGSSWRTKARRLDRHRRGAGPRDRPGHGPARAAAVRCVAVPALTLLLHLPPKDAVVTSLAVVGRGLGGGRRRRLHSRRDCRRRRAHRRAYPPPPAPTPAASPVRALSDHAQLVILGIVMLVAALALWRQPAARPRGSCERVSARAGADLACRSARTDRAGRRRRRIPDCSRRWSSARACRSAKPRPRRCS